VDPWYATRFMSLILCLEFSGGSSLENLRTHAITQSC